MEKTIEREMAENEAFQAMKQAKSRKEIEEVWKKYYLSVGHKILGRMLVGTYKSN